MAVDPITPSARAGAFFDLDKTTIATATMFAFSSTLRDEGLLDYRLVLRALHGRIVFKYLGADHDRMLPFKWQIVMQQQSHDPFGRGTSVGLLAHAHAAEAEAGHAVDVLAQRDSIEAGSLINLGWHRVL